MMENWLARPVGRPKGSEIDVDITEMKKWARAGCTVREMAQKLGISHYTMEDRLRRPEFRTALEEAKAEMIISLRSTQVKLALGGNVTMLIWLGKQFLGQKDRHEHSGSMPDGTIGITHVSAADLIKAELDRIRGATVGEHANGDSERDHSRPT